MLDESCQRHQIDDLDLPHIPMDKRVIPNDLVRSSLFTATNKTITREFFKNKALYTFGNTEISYTGEELRQDEQDVWMQIIYIASKEKSTHIKIMPYRFLKAIGWPQRVQYRDKLKDSFVRLSANNLSISNKRYKSGLSVSLVRKFTWQDTEGNKLKEWEIWLEPELVKLFSGRCYTKLVLQQRMRLTPLGKWLHSYYASHKEPYPVLVSTLHQACGSKTKALKHFKPVLRRALVELVHVGFLEEFAIDSKNRVFVVRTNNQIYLPQGFEDE